MFCSSRALTNTEDVDDLDLTRARITSDRGDQVPVTPRLMLPEIAPAAVWFAAFACPNK